MRFLFDANLPRRAAEAFRALGHDCTDVRDIQMGDAADSLVAAHAREHSLTLITRDFDFSDIRNYPPQLYAGIVVLDLPDNSTADFIVAVLISFAKNQAVMNSLPGQLAIVQPDRIRLRSS
jgi:predicted nuclease of predicted toxin-antitoxin system